MIKWCHSIPDVAASPSPCPVSVLEASLVTVRVKDATKISSNFMRASSRGLPEEANARGPGPGPMAVEERPVVVVVAVVVVDIVEVVVTVVVPGVEENNDTRASVLINTTEWAGSTHRNNQSW